MSGLSLELGLEEPNGPNAATAVAEEFVNQVDLVDLEETEGAQRGDGERMCELRG